VQIHPTAVIEPGARLSTEISVGPFAYIARDTDIGPGCNIGPHATIHPYTTLGAGCQVHAGAVIGGIPQDLAFKGEVSFLKVGNRTVLREGVTIYRGTQAGSTTRVGEDCFLMSKAFRTKTREAEERSGLPHSDDTRRELNRVLASQDSEDAK
jgi:UDP-N-acetylglucosamine acyltransferase